MYAVPTGVVNDRRDAIYGVRQPTRPTGQIPSLPCQFSSRLSELRGLGKELWQGVDAQEYVNQLRDEWDENTFEA